MPTDTKSDADVDVDLTSGVTWNVFRTRLGAEVLYVQPAGAPNGEPTQPERFTGVVSFTNDGTVATASEAGSLEQRKAQWVASEWQAMARSADGVRWEELLPRCWAKLVQVSTDACEATKNRVIVGPHAILRKDPNNKDRYLISLGFILDSVYWDPSRGSIGDRDTAPSFTSVETLTIKDLPDASVMARCVSLIDNEDSE